MEKERYNHLNSYLKNKFGQRTLKICVDGGFTCPNRDGKKGYGGCIFCGERGSGEHLKTIDISSQVHKHLESYRGQRAEKFIVYFQNFTNTYDTIENLRKKYTSALVDDRIVGLAIATRPDCIDEDIVKLLSEFTDKYYVSVELGLQTSNDETGILLNRGYTSSDFTNAVKLLNKYNIDVITHVMIGLPNETQKDLENTVNFVNSHNIQGLKIHSTYVISNTKLEDMYKNNTYSPISLEYYLESLCYVLTHINPDIIIHRISGDAPKDLLVAPSWNSHKKLVLNGIDKILREKDLYQGMYFSK
ncbi:MAG: TIGR01212 family radical SAM protein [Clostridia bacterium]|nr:TIGR01212 family radical SAM protein [Clostridia bacterium]